MAELIIGVKEDHLSELTQWVENQSGTVERELRGNLLLITLPEEEVGTLCEVNSVESVEFNESISILEKGNF